MPDLTTAQRDLLAEWQQIAIRQFDNQADAYAAGRIDLATFEQMFKQELKDLYIATTWTARGGPENVTNREYGLVGRRLRDQYGFMHDFFEEIGQGDLSLAEIKARAALYANSSRQVLEQIGLSEDDIPLLPHYPADGSTQCRTNDKCVLRKVRVTNGWDIFWQTTPAEHCPDCLRRRDRSPLRVRFGQVVNAEVWS